jgi:hypothetical protein
LESIFLSFCFQYRKIERLVQQTPLKSSSAFISFAIYTVFFSTDTLFLFFSFENLGLGCGSVAEDLPSVQEALDAVPSPENTKQNKQKRNLTLSHRSYSFCQNVHSIPFIALFSF